MIAIRIAPRRGLLPLGLAALACAAFAPPVGASPDPPNPVAARAARQLVVAIAPPRPGARADAARAAEAHLAGRFAALGVSRVRALTEALPAWNREVGANPFGLDPARILLLEAPDAGTAAAALASLAEDAEVEWVEPNRTRVLQGWIEAAPHRPAVEGAPGRSHILGGGTPPDPSVIPPFPNDPLFRAGKQYALFNLGPGGPFQGTSRADLHAAEAWSVATGSNDVILAIADTGIDPNHPDLAGLMPDGRPRLLAPINITGLDPAEAFADSFGHGTGVVGAMAARTNNGASVDTFGIAGVCGGDGAANAGCRIVAIKITPGRLGFATSFDIARALLYATELGARAMNLSFAGTEPSRIERLAMYQAITHGCVLVGAAGNSGYSDGTTAQYPSAYSADGLGIQVGASDENDQRTVWSSYGPGLDLLAPGLNVYTTFMTYPSAAGQSWPGYVPFSGTSIAAPHAAGAVGLLAAARPELIENDFQRVLRESADDLEAPGVDSFTGWGRLNLGNALAAVDPALGIWHGDVAGVLGSVVGIDTLRLDESGSGVVDHARVWARAQQIEVTATVALPDSFLDPVRVWPRVGGTYTVRGGFKLPYFAPWAEVSAQGARSFALRGYLYRRADGCTNCDEYIPVPAEQARFGFTVLGRVDRPPTVRMLAPAPATSVAPGDTLAVAFEASDPDLIGSIEIWLDTDRRGSFPIASLPGDARSARVRVPCLGQRDVEATLRVVVFDRHGPQLDQGEAAVGMVVRGGVCLTAAGPLRVSPNPARGATRIEGSPGAEVVILDLAGRRVRHTRLDTASGAWVWDGFDQRGRRVPPGLYLVRMPLGARVEERKLVRLE